MGMSIVGFVGSVWLASRALGAGANVIKWLKMQLVGAMHRVQIMGDMVAERRRGIVGERVSERTDERGQKRSTSFSDRWALRREASSAARAAKETTAARITLGERVAAIPLIGRLADTAAIAMARVDRACATAAEKVAAVGASASARAAANMSARAAEAEARAEAARENIRRRDEMAEVRVSAEEYNKLTHSVDKLAGENQILAEVLRDAGVDPDALIAAATRAREQAMRGVSVSADKTVRLDAKDIADAEKKAAERAEERAKSVRTVSTEDTRTAKEAAGVANGRPVGSHFRQDIAARAADEERGGFSVEAAGDKLTLSVPAESLDVASDGSYIDFTLPEGCVAPDGGCARAQNGEAAAGRELSGYRVAIPSIKSALTVDSSKLSLSRGENVMLHLDDANGKCVDIVTMPAEELAQALSCHKERAREMEACKTAGGAADKMREAGVAVRAEQSL